MATVTLTLLDGVLGDDTGGDGEIVDMGGPALGAELSCNDAIDNDADGNTDCFDSDCSEAPGCAGVRGVPTLSPPGRIALGVLLLGATYFAIRRRGHAAQ